MTEEQRQEICKDIAKKIVTSLSIGEVVDIVLAKVFTDIQEESKEYTEEQLLELRKELYAND